MVRDHQLKSKKNLKYRKQKFKAFFKGTQSTLKP